MMASVTKPLLTEAEYLARERAAVVRSEYLRGEVFAMAGATYAHTRIKDNIAHRLNDQFQGRPCFAVTSDQRVKVSATGLYTYPDVVVVCDPPEFEDQVLDTLLNPRVIFEVLSESTEAYDRGAKFAHYRQLGTLQEYVLVAQDRALAERYLRQPDGTWVLSEFAGLEANLSMTSAAAQLSLADVYKGVELSQHPGR